MVQLTVPDSNSSRIGQTTLVSNPLRQSSDIRLLFLSFCPNLRPRTQQLWCISALYECIDSKWTTQPEPFITYSWRRVDRHHKQQKANSSDIAEATTTVLATITTMSYGSCVISCKIYGPNVLASSSSSLCGVVGQQPQYSSRNRLVCLSLVSPGLPLGLFSLL